MAGEKSRIGTLVVDLLLKDQQFQEALKDSTKQTEVSSKAMGKSLSNFSNLSIKALSGVVAALGGLAAAATAVGTKFEQQMAMVGALQGLDQASLGFQRLTDEARRLGSSTEFTATQAAGALEELARSGMDVTQSIDTANSALVLAGTSGTSLANATQLLVSAQRQFGLESTESERITNVMSMAMRSSLLDFESLREAMKFAGTAGASFGMSLEETVAAIAKFRDLGLEGSLAGTNFRMAIQAATIETKKKVDVLQKYGLTMQDISPQSKNFEEILLAIGNAGVSATDAVTIFGARAGSNMAQLANSAAVGTLKMGELTTKLNESNKAGNEAKDMYSVLQKTIAFQTKFTISALQELGITIFDLFSGPLQDLISVLPAVINDMSNAIKLQADELETMFEAAFGSIEDFLVNNSDDLAQTFVDLIKDGVAFAQSLTTVGTTLARLAVLADELFASMRFAFYTGLVIKMGQAFIYLKNAVIAARAGVIAFSTQLSVSTGGLYALLVGVGLLVTGLFKLIKVLIGARDRTKELHEAQKRLNEENEKATQAQIAAIIPLLKKQQDAARNLLASGKQISEDEKRRLNRLIELSAEEAFQLKQQGKLIEKKGEFLTVEQMIREEGNKAVKDLERRAVLAQSEANGLRKTADEAQNLLDLYHSAGSVGVASAQKRLAINKLGLAQSATIEEVELKIKQVREEADAQEIKSFNIKNQSARAQSKILSQAQQQTINNAKTSTTLSTATANQLVSDRKSAADKIAQLMKSLKDRIASLELDEIEQAKRNNENRIADIDAAFAELLALHKGNKAKIKQLEDQRDEARKSSAKILQLEITEIETKGEQERKDRIQKINQSAQDKLASLQREGMSESQNLALEKTRVLAELAGAEGETLLEIARFYDEKIRQAQGEEYQKRLDERGSFGERLLAGSEGLFKRLQMEAGAAFGDSKLGKSFQALFGKMGTEAAKFAKRLKPVGAKFKQIFNPEKPNAFQRAMAKVGKVAKAALGGLAGTLGRFTIGLGKAAIKAAKFVSGLANAVKSASKPIVGLFNKITGFQFSISDLASDVAGAAEEARASGSELNFAEAGKSFVDGIVANSMGMIEAFVKSFPFAMRELAAQLPVLLDAFIEALPVFFNTIAGNLPIIIQGIVSRLPEIFDAVLKGLFAVLSSLLSALPGLLITLLTETIPQLLSTVATMLPLFITEIVKAIPVIIDALIEALPVLVSAIIESVPVIIMALIEAIPTIFAAIISKLPDIAIALVTAIFTQLIPMIPKMVVMVLKGIIKALFEGLKKIGQAIGDIFRSKKGKEKARERRAQREADADAKAAMEADAMIGGAFSGINYVPATMRMTLHKGEAVIPADRNASSGGRNGSAPAGYQQNFGSEGSPSDSSPIEISVIAEGRLLDAVQIKAANRGHATGMQKAIRRASGAKIGFQRGKFSAYT